MPQKRFLAGMLLVLLLPWGQAAAGEASADPDADLRTALRLSDLGYLTSPAGWVSDGAQSDALDAFWETNGPAGADEPPEKLFSRDARPPALPGGGAALPEAPLFTGAPTPYEEALGRMVPGETYALTDCGTGVVCYLVYTPGNGHAVMSPSRDWDASVLSGLLGEGSAFSKRPVALTLSGEAVAASLEPEPGVAGEARYNLFFTGGAAGFNGIADADRAAMLAYATGQR